MTGDNANYSTVNFHYWQQIHLNGAARSSHSGGIRSSISTQRLKFGLHARPLGVVRTEHLACMHGKENHLTLECLSVITVPHAVK